MCVRYTAHRKRGLIAALKRMQAEVMTLGELCVTTPPPTEKLIQNSLRKTKVGSLCPFRAAWRRDDKNDGDGATDDGGMVTGDDGSRCATA